MFGYVPSDSDVSIAEDLMHGLTESQSKMRAAFTGCSNQSSELQKAIAESDANVDFLQSKFSNFLGGSMPVNDLANAVADHILVNDALTERIVSQCGSTGMLGTVVFLALIGYILYKG